MIRRLAVVAGVPGLGAETSTEATGSEPSDPTGSTPPTPAALRCWQSGARCDLDGTCLGRSGQPGRQCSDLIAQARARRFSTGRAPARPEPRRIRPAPSAAEPVDFQLVLAAAQENAEWALTRLYVTLAPAVVGYMRSQGIREAEDFTSDVFVAVLSRTRTFSGTEAQFRNWVFTIAHHRIVDERRRNGRGPEVISLDRAEIADGQAHADACAEDEAIRRLGNERVAGLLAGLTPDQRDVLVLRVIGGMSVEEVATALEKGPEAVKGLQRRALAALRRPLRKMTRRDNDAGS